MGLFVFCGLKIIHSSDSKKIFHIPIDDTANFDYPNIADLSKNVYNLICEQEDQTQKTIYCMSQQWESHIIIY